MLAYGFQMQYFEKFIHIFFSSVSLPLFDPPDTDTVFGSTLGLSNRTLKEVTGFKKDHVILIAPFTLLTFTVRMHALGSSSLRMRDKWNRAMSDFQSKAEPLQLTRRLRRGEINPLLIQPPRLCGRQFYSIITYATLRPSK